MNEYQNPDPAAESDEGELPENGTLSDELADKLRRVFLLLRKGYAPLPPHGQQLPPLDGFHGFHMPMPHPPYPEEPSFFPVPEAQTRLLALLSLRDGITPGELAFLMGIRPQSVGELIAKLERAGYIVRRRSDLDRRSLRLYLTDSGREQSEKLSAVRNRTREDVFTALTEEEQKQMIALLDKLLSAQEKTPPIRPDGLKEKC